MKRIVWAVLMSLLATSAFATIAVRRKATGAYDFLVYNSQIYGGLLVQWLPIAPRPDEDYLNIGGDDNGDLTPTFTILAPGALQSDPTPIIVWSRPQGGNHDIVYSMWMRSGGWTPVQRVNALNEFHDLGVRVLRDRFNHVHLIWWSSERPATVWYSKFIGSSWSTPERLSTHLQDARNPSFVITDQKLYVRFEDWSTSPLRLFSFLKEDFDE